MKKDNFLWDFGTHNRDKKGRFKSPFEPVKRKRAPPSIEGSSSSRMMDVPSSWKGRRGSFHTTEGTYDKSGAILKHAGRKKVLRGLSRVPKALAGRPAKETPAAHERRVKKAQTKAKKQLFKKSRSIWHSLI